MHVAVAIAIVLAGTLVAVTICVLLHYEGLLRMAQRFRGGGSARGRRQVLLAVVGVLVLHLLEIGVFGAAWWGLLAMPGAGHVAGTDPLRWHDALFMSSLSFTSLGFDGLAPVGAIRILAGVEALTGFVLITWSASFAYLQMARHWPLD